MDGWMVLSFSAQNTWHNGVHNNGEIRLSIKIFSGPARKKEGNYHDNYYTTTTTTTTTTIQ
jgi:hypothetical protein